MQGAWNRVITEYGVALDADFLFLVAVFQSLSACHVHYVENEKDLKFQKAIAAIATVHPQALLQVTLLLPQHVHEAFFVCFARLLRAILPQFDWQLLVTLLLLREHNHLKAGSHYEEKSESKSKSSGKSYSSPLPVYQLVVGLLEKKIRYLTGMGASFGMT